jgi:hypothetical protein
MPGSRPYTNNHAHKKLNAKGVSESISPLPNFRKRLSVAVTDGWATIHSELEEGPISHLDE